MRTIIRPFPLRATHILLVFRWFNHQREMCLKLVWDDHADELPNAHRYRWPAYPHQVDHSANAHALLAACAVVAVVVPGAARRGAMDRFVAFESGMIIFNQRPDYPVETARRKLDRSLFQERAVCARPTQLEVILDDVAHYAGRADFG